MTLQNAITDTLEQMKALESAYQRAKKELALIHDKCEACFEGLIAELNSALARLALSQAA